MTVYLTGTENLPPFIKAMVNSSYNYHAHELKCEPCEDGFNYKYSLTVSKVPLNANTTTTTTSDDDPTTATSLITEPSTIQSVQYCVKPLKCSKDVKYSMMIQVKFILLHLDNFGNRVQSMFIDEVSTDETLHDAIMRFRDKCVAKMPKGKPFHPRMSLCIGEVKRENSKPIMQEDLSKLISEVVDNLSGKVFLVADTLDYF